MNTWNLSFEIPNMARQMQLQWSRRVQPFATSGNTTKGSEEAVKFSDELRPAKMQKVSPGGCWWQQRGGRAGL